MCKNLNCMRSVFSAASFFRLSPMYTEAELLDGESTRPSENMCLVSGHTERCSQACSLGPGLCFGLETAMKEGCSACLWPQSMSSSPAQCCWCGTSLWHGLWLCSITFHRHCGVQLLCPQKPSNFGGAGERTRLASPPLPRNLGPF